MFTGNLDEERSELELLLTGSSGEGLVRVLLAENHLEKLALYWAKGGKIPWAALHADGPCHLIPLPTYPFARERYWVQASAVPQSDAEQRSSAGDELSPQVVAAHGSQSHDAVVVASGDSEFSMHPDHGVRDNMQRYLVWFLCKETGLTPDQIKPGKGLRSYGVDSITSSRLMRGFEKYFQVRVTGREMVEHRTIESLVTYLAGKVEARYAQTRSTQPAPGNGTHARAEYMDEQVLQALDQWERGTSDLEAVQRIIGGSTTRPMKEESL
jgi:acyl transferase domain-containing protein